MLRRLVLGLGAAGLIGGSAATGQFASDRTAPGAPKAPAPFGGVGPAGPAMPGVRPAGGYAPPAGGFTPAAASTPAPGFPPPSGFAPPAGLAPAPAAAAPAEPLAIPTALGDNHPLALRPEHGPYMILLRSYSRPARADAANPGMTAKQLAEALVAEVQRTPQAKGLGVYLFEHISEERKAEAQAAADARQRLARLNQSIDVLRQKSEINGMEFLNPDSTTLRYRTFNYRDQIGVLVGGFRTEDEAVKALARVKTWPVPQDTRLLDGGAIAKYGPDGKATIEKTFLNPYGQAMVVANPSVPKAAPVVGPPPKLDPFVVQLNDGRPYSLLKATKGWTLGVKSFNAPTRVQSRDDEGVGIKLFSLTKTGDVLNAGAEQAEELAKVLRSMKSPGGENRSLGLEAFVLHHRHGSMVTVGQFDGPNDPMLAETRRMLSNMNFMAGDPRASDTARRLFHEVIIPIPIPRQ